MASKQDVEGTNGHLQASGAISEQPSSYSWTWTFAGRVWDSLKYSWSCFDKHVGYWIGLDTPKYAWAIHEHNRLLKEAEESVLHTDEFKKKEKQMDEVEGGMGELKAHSAPSVPEMGNEHSQGDHMLAQGQSSAKGGFKCDSLQEKYEFFKT